MTHGVILQLVEPFPGTPMRAIEFQFNPDSVSRSLTAFPAETTGGGTGCADSKPRRQPSDPEESIEVRLEFDAADALEAPQGHPVEVVSGVADRIAALEMLLYPTGSSLLEQGLAKVLGRKFAGRLEVPVVLFLWGPGRVLPVRLASLTVEEQAFSATLYPIRATVSVRLEVLTAESIASSRSEDDTALTASERLAIAAYQWTRGQKELLAQTRNAKSSIASLPVGLP